MGMALSFYKLSDLLQIPLTWAGGTLEGERTVQVTTTLGLDLPLEVKAVKLFAKDQVGVVVHIRGDLYMIAAHNPESNTVSAYLMDKSKLPDTKPVEKMIAPGCSLREVFNIYRSGIVQGFSWRGDKWKPLKLPD